MTARPFTLATYAELLDTAREAGYEFTSFAEIGGAERPALVVRHDIDDRPCWIEPLARLERDHGARSTYCLQLRSPFYAIDTDEARRAVETLLECGHELALHFDSSSLTSDDEVVAGAAAEAAELERRFGVEVRVVSFHQPGLRPVGHLELPDGLINTYAPRFFSEIGYLSDSNQDWRGNDPFAVIGSRRHARLQLLTHPTLWREQPTPLRAIVAEQAERLGTTVDELLTEHQREVVARQDRAA